MQFTPITEADEKGAREFTLLPDGDYDFEVLTAEEKYSAKGDCYIWLKLGVWDVAGRQQWVFASLLSIDSMLWKLRHFAQSVGIEKDYESGNINPINLIKLTGKCKIHSKKDLKGVLRNDVKDYIPRVSKPASFSDALKKGINPPVIQQAPPVQPAMQVVDGDDDVPF